MYQDEMRKLLLQQRISKCYATISQNAVHNTRDCRSKIVLDSYILLWCK